MPRSLQKDRYLRSVCSGLCAASIARAASTRPGCTELALWQLVLVSGAAGGIGSVVTSVCALMGSTVSTAAVDGLVLRFGALMQVYGLVNDAAQRDFACTSGKPHA